MENVVGVGVGGICGSGGVVAIVFNVISVAEVIIYGYEVIIATLGTLKTSCLVNFPCQI